MEAEDNKCNKDWNNGECCCNCKNQIELFKHPWNKINKGSMNESTSMYTCIMQYDCYGESKGILFENQHGICEMYIPK